MAHVQGPPVHLTPGVTVGGLSSRNGPIAGSAVVGREEEGGEPGEWGLRSSVHRAARLC